MDVFAVFLRCTVTTVLRNGWEEWMGDGGDIFHA